MGGGGGVTALWPEGNASAHLQLNTLNMMDSGGNGSQAAANQPKSRSSSLLNVFNQEGKCFTTGVLGCKV